MGVQTSSPLLLLLLAVDCFEPDEEEDAVTLLIPFCGSNLSDSISSSALFAVVVSCNLRRLLFLLFLIGDVASTLL